MKNLNTLFYDVLKLLSQTRLINKLKFYISITQE